MEEAVVRRLTWRLVPFLFLLYIVAYLDRINVGFAALQMQQQLGFTDAVYGLGGGIVFCGVFLFSGAQQSGVGTGGGSAVDRVADDDLGSDFVGDGAG